MEISKRWKCINGWYYVALIIFNGVNGIFEYYLLECEVKVLRDDEFCVQGLNPVIGILFSIITQIINSIVPALLLFKAMRNLEKSHNTILDGLHLPPH
jgi:hypothetical protein